MFFFALDCKNKQILSCFLEKHCYSFRFSISLLAYFSFEYVYQLYPLVLFIINIQLHAYFRIAITFKFSIFALIFLLF